MVKECTKIQQKSEKYNLPPVHKIFLESRGIGHNEYTRLHRPAFAWLANELGRKSDSSTFKKTIKNYNSQ